MIRGDGKEPGFDWFYRLKLPLSLEIFAGLTYPKISSFVITRDGLNL